MKIFFYIDSAVAFGNSVTAAEMFRRKLDAEIVMMCVDSHKYLNSTTESYTLFDYSNLFRPDAGFAPVWPIGDLHARPRASVLGLLRKVTLNLIRGLVHWGTFGRSSMFTRRLANWAYRIVRWGSFDRVPASFRFGDYLRLTALIALLPLSLIFRILIKSIVRSVAVVVRMFRHSRVAARLSDLGRMVHFRAAEASNTYLKPPLRMLICYGSIARFLDDVKPDLIILAEGNVETLSASFIAQGRKRGIPTIVLPFTLPNPLEPAQYYKDSEAHRAKGLIARVLCTLWPKWRFNFEGLELVRLPPHTALLAELLGVSSPAPWVLNRGDAAAIALDSQAQRDQYLRLGFPPTQLHVIGDALGETLYSARCNKEKLLASLFSAHGFDASKPLVLCGFPPDQFDSYDPTGFEFPDYRSLVSAWASVFRELKDHANFLVRPHPRSSIAQNEFLRSQGLEICMDATAELIPLCDIYLASISATIRWAIACGIPVINYDTYRYRYGDFNSAAGVFSVETADDFRDTLRRLLTDPEFASEARRKQQKSMDYWGLSDGKTSDRLAALALKVVGAN